MVLFESLDYGAVLKNICCSLEPFFKKSVCIHFLSYFFENNKFTFLFSLMSEYANLGKLKYMYFYSKFNGECDGTVECCKENQNNTKNSKF
jgi:hypothetical protein